jgi:hypothetical protein
LKNASETVQIKDMKKDLGNRTKKFALAVIEFVSLLPRTREADVLANQVLRSGTSIGANYREANRGVSRADFAKQNRHRPKGGIRNAILARADT